jgi:hypothetical protein
MTRLWLAAAVALTACGGGNADEPIPRIDVGTPTEEEAPDEPFPERSNSCTGDECNSFCTATTWGGDLPSREADLVIAEGETVVIDCEAEVGSLTIEPGGALVASRNTDSRLDVYGNLVVRGILNYGTTETRISSDVRAEVVFHPAPDDDYVGTPTSVQSGSESEPSVSTEMRVEDADRGLWVVDEGRFFAAGSVKTGWTRLRDAAGPDDTNFDVDDVTGWHRGDRLAFVPTAEGATVDGFEESLLSDVHGRTVIVEGGLRHDHVGCADCVRRGEVLNLTRNVVFRSYDDGAHAHIMVADRAIARLDSVELRWLGPRACDGPERRAALYFHQQDDASRESYLRHVAIWGGEREFVVMERSHGVTMEDVVGYDGFGAGFVAKMDRTNCGAECTDAEASIPTDSQWTGVVAARVSADAGSCAAPERVAGFVLPGTGGGCAGCVAVGVAAGTSESAGFRLGEGGGLPEVFRESVAHHNDGHGFLFWQNDVDPGHPYNGLVAYSNAAHGVHWGAQGNALALTDYTAIDNGESSLGLRAVPITAGARVERATVDDVRMLPPTAPPDEPTTVVDLEFTGTRDVGVTQSDAECAADAPDSVDCPRTWLRMVNPIFADGMQPFRFGDPGNLHTIWEIRGFEQPGYPDLPADFDLHRRDNEIEGGFYHSEFDAWLVPR